MPSTALEIVFLAYDAASRIAPSYPLIMLSWVELMEWGFASSSKSELVRIKNVRRSLRWWCWRENSQPKGQRGVPRHLNSLVVQFLSLSYSGCHVSADGSRQPTHHHRHHSPSKAASIHTECRPPTAEGFNPQNLEYSISRHQVQVNNISVCEICYYCFVYRYREQRATEARSGDVRVKTTVN